MNQLRNLQMGLEYNEKRYAEDLGCLSEQGLRVLIWDQVLPVSLVLVRRTWPRAAQSAQKSGFTQWKFLATTSSIAAYFSVLLYLSEGNG